MISVWFERVTVSTGVLSSLARGVWVGVSGWCCCRASVWWWDFAHDGVVREFDDEVVMRLSRGMVGGRVCKDRRR